LCSQGIALWDSYVRGGAFCAIATPPRFGPRARRATLVSNYGRAQNRAQSLRGEELKNSAVIAGLLLSVAGAWRAQDVPQVPTMKVTTPAAIVWGNDPLQSSVTTDPITGNQFKRLEYEGIDALLMLDNYDKPEGSSCVHNCDKHVGVAQVRIVNDSAYPIYVSGKDFIFSSSGNAGLADSKEVKRYLPSEWVEDYSQALGFKGQIQPRAGITLKFLFGRVVQHPRISFSPVYSTYHGPPSYRSGPNDDSSSGFTGQVSLPARISIRISGTYFVWPIQVFEY